MEYVQKSNQKECTLKVIIHHCEKIKLDILLCQPVLCMHIIDVDKGTYLKKSDRNRAAVSFYENQRDDVDYIMPVMTQPCMPSDEKFVFEEEFILNENFDTFVRKDTSVVFCFEVIDLIPISYPKLQKKSYQSGMKKLAWAFLKAVGCNRIINFGSKLQLQLYKPSKIGKSEMISHIEVCNWFKKQSKIPMDSSLCVSIEPYDGTLSVEPALRSFFPIQQEKGSVGFDNLAFGENLSVDTSQSKSVSETKLSLKVKWSRKSGEPCEVPTKISTLLKSVSSCHILKFSLSGRMLAAGCGNQNSYYLMVYQIPQENLVHKCVAHSESIYDLDWSHHDHYLLSASGDYSVKVWNSKTWTLSYSFLHPSFVYASKFHPVDKVLVSACYDHVIRLWSLGKSQVLKELESHTASVCALCWNRSGTKFFSADSIGKIKVWKYYAKTLKDMTAFNLLEREFNPEETSGISINKIDLDPDENTLYLFCRDSVLRLLDLRSGNILSSFGSGVSSLKFSKSCCSPCGNLIFLSSVNSNISVWDKNFHQDVGELVHQLSYGGVSCIEYHPFEHMVAVSFWDDNVPIHIYVKENDKITIETVYEKPKSKSILNKKKQKNTMEFSNLKRTNQQENNNLIFEETSLKNDAVPQDKFNDIPAKDFSDLTIVKASKVDLEHHRMSKRSLRRKKLLGIT